MASTRAWNAGSGQASTADNGKNKKWLPPDNGHENGQAFQGGNASQWARALGWFSLGLGLMQIAAPRRVAELVGLEQRDQTNALMRAVGLREVVSGIGILTQAQPTPWIWARVGGDALDLALLTSAMGSPGADRNRVAAATAAVVGVTAADALLGARLSAEVEPAAQETSEPRSVPVATAITVGAPANRVYQAWEGFRNLPRFMGEFASVEVTDDRVSRWRAALPAGRSLEWDVEITESSPNERIAWQTSEGAPVAASGQIRFRQAPRDQGTEVIFTAEFTPPGGELGARIGGIFSDPIGTKIQNDLRRFKQLMELGEIVASDDSVISGPNPAQPTTANSAA